MRERTNVIETIILATVLLACMNRESYAQDPCLKWTHLVPAHSPSARYAPTAVYEAAQHRTLLFGGYRGSYPVGTWAWDGADWTWLTDSGPAGINGHGMAYDSVRQRVVLFGGVPDPTNDTWEWDGTSWAQQPDAPPDLTPRVTVLAYDEARQQTILFGGEGGGSNLGDTWAWDGSQWLRLAESGPSPRHFQAMAYDAARQEIVLFGGTTALSGTATEEQVLGDTWVWNGSVWSQKAPPNSPTRRLGATMVFDTRRQTVVMFGGWAAGPTWLGEMWEWNGNTWSAVEDGPNPPPARDLHAMAYDSDRDVVVVFGGRSGSAEFLGDTWELSGTIQCPTVSQWGLIVMAGLVAAAGGSILHKRPVRVT